MEKPSFTPKLQEVIDSKLDEISFHQKKIQELSAQIDEAKLNLSDSEHKDQMHQAQQIIQDNSMKIAKEEAEKQLSKNILDKIVK